VVPERHAHLRRVSERTARASGSSVPRGGPEVSDWRWEERLVPAGALAPPAFFPGDSAGFLYGKASNARTWEIGYFYQHLEKDALYAQYIDSDWGSGNTDAKGSVLKFGYAIARGWTFNGTYFLNKTNMDAAASGTGVPAGTFNRDYKRLQLDLNFKF
jgi:hypothetical protein